jgi:hypothetical protein
MKSNHHNIHESKIQNLYEIWTIIYPNKKLFNLKLLNYNFLNLMSPI